MEWFKIAVSITVIDVFLPILALAVEGETPAGDTVIGSRWAKVDFTQYCGSQVGELLDTLGNDYDGYYFDEEPAGFLNSCTFTYNDGEVRIFPLTFDYCQRDRREGPWETSEFRKETIDYLQVEIRAPKDGSARKPATIARLRTGFTFDYPDYIGGTIDSLLRDVGYICEASWADTGGGCYFGCWFSYPNHVTIRAALETFVPIPTTVTATNMIDEYVLAQKIGTLTIYYCERKGKRY